MMDYFVPAIALLGGLVFAGNAWLAFTRGRLYFFEFHHDNQIQRSRDPLLFNIAFFGSILISLAAIVLGTGMLMHEWSL